MKFVCCTNDISSNQKICIHAINGKHLEFIFSRHATIVQEFEHPHSARNIGILEATLSLHQFLVGFNPCHGCHELAAFRPNKIAYSD